MDFSSLSQAASSSQQNLVSSLLGASSTSTTSTDPMTVILDGQEQMLTMSAEGKAASQANSVALQSSNPNVEAGLEQVMQSINAQPLNEASFAELSTINQLASTSPSAFDTAMTNVNSLYQQGMSSAIQPYVSAIGTANTQTGATGVAALNTDVTNAITNGAGNAAAIMQALTSVFQQYSPTTGTTTSNPTSTSSTSSVSGS